MLFVCDGCSIQTVVSARNLFHIISISGLDGEDSCSSQQYSIIFRLSDLVDEGFIFSEMSVANSISQGRHDTNTAVPWKIYLGSTVGTSNAGVASPREVRRKR